MVTFISSHPSSPFPWTNKVRPIPRFFCFSVHQIFPSLWPKTWKNLNFTAIYSRSSAHWLSLSSIIVITVFYFGSLNCMEFFGHSDSFHLLTETPNPTPSQQHTCFAYRNSILPLRLSKFFSIQGILGLFESENVSPHLWNPLLSFIY